MQLTCGLQTLSFTNILNQNLEVAQLPSGRTDLDFRATHVDPRLARVAVSQRTTGPDLRRLGFNRTLERVQLRSGMQPVDHRHSRFNQSLERLQLPSVPTDLWTFGAGCQPKHGRGAASLQAYSALAIL